MKELNDTLHPLIGSNPQDPGRHSVQVAPWAN